MNVHDKLLAIESFLHQSYAFDDTLNLGKEILLFRPFDDAWSIVEQVVHCVDFDVANFHRYRWGIVSPGMKVLSFDATWAVTLDYQASDLPVAIDTIKAVRHFMAAHLRTIVDSDWTKYMYSVGDEKSFNLEEAIKHFINHVGFHRELIDRNIRMFSK